MTSRPEPRDRSRSRSPRRRSPGAPKSKNFSGLKYKNDRDSRVRKPRDSSRDRDRRPRDSDRERRDPDRRRDDRDRDRRPRSSDRDRRRRSRSRDGERKPREPKKEKENKAPASAPVAVSTEPMILVTINDRLGTKTQVPCLPSDPIKLLKAMVAAKIGRPVHEIMLKRQGERPFRDTAEVQDCGISHGVQIDLELNTGD
ncbi:ubiquitin-like protein [Clathrospora elynae]|uniref:Ubiquitin-like modifier HUB1 n=1 Tax=Clathrospora elynae TaxID=706981 RepID=A0A6A5SLS2_9PLEO|nr:ubiquitin-like protein [Clathrospora elynae]